MRVMIIILAELITILLLLSVAIGAIQLPTEIF